jgi:hypothetical protein
MTENKNITERMAARILGLTEQVLDELDCMGVGPYLDLPKLKHPYKLSDVLRFKSEMGNPNDLISSEGGDPSFAKHDDGRWWLIRWREQAERRGSRRYFTGERCDRGHRVERFLKNNQCVLCAELRAGRKAIVRKWKEPSLGKNSGCKIPSVPA